MDAWHQLYSVATSYMTQTTLSRRYSYDEYIWASVSLYLDVINLFLSLLSIFRAAES
ncbi:hypothetical protein AHAS_Ahas12G0069900 [Arachis hypogaea]